MTSSWMLVLRELRWYTLEASWIPLVEGESDSDLHLKSPLPIPLEITQLIDIKVGLTEEVLHILGTDICWRQRSGECLGIEHSLNPQTQKVFEEIHRYRSVEAKRPSAQQLTKSKIIGCNS
jgi:hypothetical protein